MTADTLDTDSVAAAGITFSNGNLTALAASSAAFRNSSIAQASEGKKSGKWCVSWTLNVNGSSIDGVGIGNSAGIGNDFTGGGAANGNNTILYTAGGTIYRNVTSQTAVNNTGFTAGDRIDQAIDLDNQRLWWRKNGGVWVGTSGTPNPATNTGGFDISFALQNNLRVFPSVDMEAATSKWTADFSTSAAGGSPPAGFTAGWTNTTSGTYFGSLLVQANTGFGTSGIGSASTGPFVSKYVSTLTGAVTQIVMASVGGSATAMVGVVYDATGASGGPGALLGFSTNTVTTVNAVQEMSFTFSGLNVTSGTTYWIGVSTNSGSSFMAPPLTTGAYRGATAYGTSTHPNPFVIAGGTTANGRLGALVFVTTSSTETGSGTMSFAGVAFTARTNDDHLTGGMAFSGISLAGAVNDHQAAGLMSFAGLGLGGAVYEIETAAGVMGFAGISLTGAVNDDHATGAMAFAGISMNGIASLVETGAGAMAFTGISMAGLATRVETGDGLMSFTGIALRGSVFDYPPAGFGRRSSWTYGA